MRKIIFFLLTYCFALNAHATICQRVISFVIMDGTSTLSAGDINRAKSPYAGTALEALWKEGWLISETIPPVRGSNGQVMVVLQKEFPSTYQCDFLRK
ncbi:TPA: hypothetical protein ACIJY7_004198 [Klebsiella pneumoniae]|uniref:hypothetical protein n=1 Tax=Klebsiella pneumoniae complex TaxID=3390273 RepID=UPI00111C2362|nr:MULTISPECIES: hypothetical protein [Klebsiella]EKU3965321.1 hypothetical protein [Klebsiella pneumoniae]QTI12702.1 hypothetical protein JJB14_08490 [Klebsiella variicola]HBR5711474.1 hypothetical protein [Klebsiella pneumoniae]